MKKLFKTLLIGASVIVGIAPAITKANQANTVERHIINDLYSPKAKYSITNHIGGLPLVTEYYGNPPGLTPKEYGIRHGNGKSRKGKVNKKHRSHLMKIKVK